MARTRISTTVSEERLSMARSLEDWRNDAEMVDAALDALIRARRDAEIDAAYVRAYADQPATTPDAWGDLATFRDAAART